MTLYACSRQGHALDLSPSDPNTKILYPKLDISLAPSISALAETVKAELSSLQRGAAGEEQGRVILINNVGIAPLEPGPDTVQKVLDVNYQGTLQVRSPRFSGRDLEGDDQRCAKRSSPSSGVRDAL